MAIVYYSEGTVKVPSIKRRKVTEWIKQVASNYGRKVGNITYIFCDDEYILSVNKKYLKHDYYTDIITFDYDEADIISGEMFISLDTVVSNAKEYGEDYKRELFRVIIHGILHLCGINDKGLGEREIMEQKENEALALIEKDIAANLIIK